MKLKLSILVIFCLALFLPLIQMSLHVFKEKSLSGSFASVEKPTFEYSSWMKGNFQESYELYLKGTIEIRKKLIRINNQLDFSLFNKSNAKNTIVGKSRFLFEESYIFAHRGDDFKGSNQLGEKVKKIKLVQDKLSELGIQFVFIIAPGKASFYEEYIPEYYNIQHADSTNYEVVAKELIRNNVNHIDFGKYFLDIKQQSKYTLIPKNGIHWSYYGVTLVMDSIAKYMESIMNFDLVDFESKKGTIAYTSSEVRGTDSDIGDALNLLFEPKNSTLYYPDVVFANDNTKDKPNLLSIGDSFNNSFFSTYPYYSTLFSDQTRFWYYNQTVNWPDSLATQGIWVKNLDIWNEIKDRDVVMIVSTERNLDNPGFGFQDMIFPYLFHGTEKHGESSLRNNKINEIIDIMKANPNWLESIKQKAIKNNRSLEEQIRLDAEWTLDNQ